jgi:hypothetical protein
VSETEPASSRYPPRPPRVIVGGGEAHGSAQRRSTTKNQGPGPANLPHRRRLGETRIRR